MTTLPSSAPRLVVPAATSRQHLEFHLEHYLELVLTSLEAWNHPTFPFFARTYEELVYKLGSPMRPAPELPAHLRPGTPRECFRNAALVALANHDYRYCEGYALSPGSIPVLHAWNLPPLSSDNLDLVLDVTWPNTTECAYFGLEIPRPALLEHLQATGLYGVIPNNYVLGSPLLQHGRLLDACRPLI